MAASTRRRVVITGMGVVSPLGNSVAEMWERAVAGRSGIRRMTRNDPDRDAWQGAGGCEGLAIGRGEIVKRGEAPE